MREGEPPVGLVLGERVQVRLVRRIGEGGMGTVYLAESTTSGLPYAVKLLQPRLCQRDDALRRFLREALIAASIHHPGVVSVVDAGRRPDGAGYYVMELLTGEDLATTLRREGRLAWPRVRHIALQICDAMAAVHAHDIVHRDLKPANCFRMLRGGDADAIKILDFGVAKIAAEDASSLTGADAFLGTIPYMAPELLRTNGARDGDARVDIWALAVTIHELLTSARPFQANNVFQLIDRIQREPPAALATSPGSWPDGLQAVLNRALANDPQHRFQDMNAFAVALQALAAGRPDAGEFVVAADPLGATVPLEGAREPGIPTDDEQAHTTARPPTTDDAASSLRSIRSSANFYVDPASRWRPEPLPLPGGAFFAVVRGELALERVDAVVCGVAREGLQRGSPAWRLCEFGGPSVAKIVDRLHHHDDDLLVCRVGGGRLAASHVIFVVQPDEFPDVDAAHAFVDRAVGACLDRAFMPAITSLSVPLFMASSSGMSQRVCLESVVAAFARQLGAAPPFTLGTLRVVIDDRGDALARAGGVLSVRLRHRWISGPEAVQRFVIGRYRTVAELAVALADAVPPRCRPAGADEAASWTLRRLHDGHLFTRAELLDERPTSLASAGIVPGSTLELELGES